MLVFADGFVGEVVGCWIDAGQDAGSPALACLTPTAGPGSTASRKGCEAEFIRRLHLIKGHCTKGPQASRCMQGACIRQAVAQPPMRRCAQRLVRHGARAQRNARAATSAAAPGALLPLAGAAGAAGQPGLGYGQQQVGALAVGLILGGPAPTPLGLLLLHNWHTGRQAAVCVGNARGCTHAHARACSTCLPPPAAAHLQGDAADEEQQRHHKQRARHRRKLRAAEAAAAGDEDAPPQRHLPKVVGEAVRRVRVLARPRVRVRVRARVRARARARARVRARVHALLLS